MKEAVLSSIKTLKGYCRITLNVFLYTKKVDDKENYYWTC